MTFWKEGPSTKPKYGDENLAERFVWIPYVAAHISCDQMERVPGASWQKAPRRCQADFSVIATHYQSDAFQLAQCLARAATLLILL